jgi:hypothetical protein
VLEGFFNDDRRLPSSILPFRGRHGGLRRHGSLDIFLSNLVVRGSDPSLRLAEDPLRTNCGFSPHLFPCLRFAVHLATPNAKLGAEWIASPYP